MGIVVGEYELGVWNLNVGVIDLDGRGDEDEVDLFNNFLNDLKEKFPKEQYMEFWILFCDNKITLISEKENERSKYTEKQCDEWLEEISKKDAIPSTIKDMGDLLLDID